MIHLTGALDAKQDHFHFHNNKIIPQPSSDWSDQIQPY